MTTTTTTTTPLTGVDLARQIRAFIDTNPDRFDMEVWAGTKVGADPVCGTTMCLAGTAVFLNGGEFLFPKIDRRAEFWGDGDEILASKALMPDGRKVHISFEAARLLNIPDPYGEGEDFAPLVFSMDDEDAIEWLDEYIATGQVPA